jgi:hypothetical protein
VDAKGADGACGGAIRQVGLGHDERSRGYSRSTW